MGDYNADKYPAVNKVRMIAFGYLLAPQTNLKIDQFSTDSTKKVYSIVRKIGSTRLKILVEPTDVPT